MTTSSVNHLKLFEGRSPETAQPDIENVAGLPALLRAFEEVTGWSLVYHCGAKPIHRTQLAWSAPAVDTARSFYRRRVARIYPLYAVSLGLSLVVHQVWGGGARTSCLVLVAALFFSLTRLEVVALASPRPSRRS